VILGFPLVFLLAWHLEVRPDGIHRTVRAGLLSRAQSATLFSFMLIAMGGLAYVFFQYYSGVFESTQPGQDLADRKHNPVPLGGTYGFVGVDQC